MMRIEDLLSATALVSATDPEMNPLVESDALQEGQLLDVRFDAVRLTVGVLFELRVALQLRQANTGVLVAHGVRQLMWSGSARASTRTAWSVGGSDVSSVGSMFELKLGLWPSPGAQLHLVAERAAFFIGDVPGLADAPPDYVKDDDEMIRAQLASWGSPFVLLSAVSLDRGVT